MDLSAAFDLVPWPAIKEALELAQVDASIQVFLLQWLGQVRYRFRHKNLEKEIWPCWGLLTPGLHRQSGALGSFHSFAEQGV